MKYQIQWWALVLVFAMGVAGSMGCATMAASAAGDVVVGSDFYLKPVLTDEIVAIGQPDAVLAREFGQDHILAFLGLKNTYLLYKGGEELERISQLKLDGKRMDIDAARTRSLYLRDKQVWGELILTYGGGAHVSSEELAELEKGGFKAISVAGNTRYQKTISIEGIVNPMIKLPDEQMSKLTTHRQFGLYNPRDAKPPVMNKLIKVPLIAAGVAVDVALTPVYVGLLGVTLVIAGVEKVTH